MKKKITVDEVIRQLNQFYYKPNSFLIENSVNSIQVCNPLFMPKQAQLSLSCDKYFKLLTFLVLFLAILAQNQAGSYVKTPQPWTAQAGFATFTLSSPDTLNTVGDLKFLSNFAVNLRILKDVPQTFQIVLGYRKLDILFSPQGSITPSTSITAPLTGNSATTTFNIAFYIEDQRLLNQVKVNYLLIGYELVLSSMVQSFLIEHMLPSFGPCDALAGAQTCPYDYPITMPSLTYKKYYSITAFDMESKSTNLATLTQTATDTKFDSKIKSFTLTNWKIEFKSDKVKFTGLKFYAIIVHPNMFDQTIIKKTMFIQLVQSLNSLAPFSQAFAQTVFPTNYFVGFQSFKGNKWSFEVTESNPNDIFLGAKIFGSSNLFDFFAIVMYGYTSVCRGYRYCLSCYIGPNFDCTQCEKNFVLNAPFNTDSSCQCPTPLTIVSGVCDNHQFGCSVVVRLSNGALDCKQCDISKMLVLNPTTKLCECKPYFAMDANLVCQEICGDGVIVNAECDDANTFSGDGCSSSCMLESGFDCVTTVQPTKCKSQSMLFYKIDRITKQLSSNKAIMRLILPIKANYPFAVLKQNFEPISSYLNLRIILSMTPYTEIIVNDLQIVDIDSKNTIQMSFSFNQTIEGTQGKLILNYQNTLYFNYIQSLDFTLAGENAALIYEAQIDTYKAISYAMLAGAILNSLMLFVGFVSPKFIGLESILTLQLIFFSQTLIYDHLKFPIGFLLLQTLQYSTGFNNIFQLTEYYTSTEKAKKMNYIKRHKTIIQNFNINFVVLLFALIVLLVIFVMRTRQDKLALMNKDNKSKDQEKKAQKEKLLKKPNNQNSGRSLKKINDIIFYICNQIAFWLFLPLFSAVAAQMTIQNENVIQDQSDLSSFIAQKLGQIIAIPSFLIIYAILMSNFGNIWQSNESMSNAYERPEEIYYKRWLFVYLQMMGFLLLFMEEIYYMKVYSSVIVIMIQIIHMIVIFYINPYKMSLKVHTVGMLLNNFIYFAFLVLINFINYMQKIPPAITMFFGYGMIAFCVISIVITIVRLYYELRYGRELEMQMQEERLLREKEENLRKQALLKSKMEQMENAARMKISEKQRQRQRNVYLHENQINQDQKKQLVNWLDSRPIEKKVKQAYYFQKFAQKPMEWLKVHDFAKYELKINEINQHLHINQLKTGQKLQDQKYKALTSQLRKQVKSIKKVQDQRVRLHEKAIKTDNNYSMNIHKIHQQKMVNQAYQLKE